MPILDLDALPEWAENLASLAKALGLPAPSSPAWRLAGPASPSPACLPAVFWGFAVEEAGRMPWQASMDHDEREAWPMRWARRAEDLGFDDSAPTCVVGLIPSPQGPRYAVALTASLRLGLAGGSLPMTAFNSPAKWKEWMEDFCTVMDIPWKGPRWWLAYADFNEGAG